MYHEMAIGIQDKLEGVKKDMKEAERLEALCDGILFKRTKLKLKDLLAHKEKKSDWYFSPTEAFKYGIIDEIIGAPLISKENAKALQKAPRKTTKK
jgi:ATP-dependent protease ClpP protease subunit